MKVAALILSSKSMTPLKVVPNKELLDLYVLQLYLIILNRRTLYDVCTCTLIDLSSML
jgi:hypothetical protein